MAIFTYDLGHNWKLEQTVNEVKGKGIVETMSFYNGKEAIYLPNESCQKLRDLFKILNK